MEYGGNLKLENYSVFMHIIHHVSVSLNNNLYTGNSRTISGANKFSLGLLSVVVTNVVGVYC